MADDDGEKEHEPTQKKLDDARKKGEIARSTDLTVAASYGGFLLASLAFGTAAFQSAGTRLMAPLDRAPEMIAVVFGETGGRSVTARLAFEALWALAPWLLVPGLISLAVLLAQRGIVFAPTKLQPKLSRISLISNAKNKFGRSGLFEFSKSFVKLLLYSSILGFFLAVEMPKIVASMAMSPGMIMTLLSSMLVRFLLIVLVVASVLAGIDLMWQRAEHIRKNRMSHKEMKDELKQSEGDPTLKAARRQRGYDIATNRMLDDVPEADVVIVNPTHYAVALKWNRAAGGAPKCIAKGVDEIAARIRELAQTNGIPIHSDPPTARGLFATVEIGEQIRTEHYRAVAAAVRFADGIRARMKSK